MTNIGSEPSRSSTSISSPSRIRSRSRNTRGRCRPGYSSTTFRRSEPRCWVKEILQSTAAHKRVFIWIEQLGQPRRPEPKSFRNPTHYRHSRSIQQITRRGLSEQQEFYLTAEIKAFGLRKSRFSVRLRFGSNSPVCSPSLKGPDGITAGCDLNGTLRLGWRTRHPPFEEWHNAMRFARADGWRFFVLTG